MMRLGTCSIISFLAAGLACQETLKAQTTNDPSEFHEVYSLIQENLPGIKLEELDHAAAAGLALALAPRVMLITNDDNSASQSTNQSSPLILKSNVFDGQIAYLRIGRVADGLANAIKEGCRDLGKTNKLKGVVLDLRYADGDDYQAAAAAADVFVRKEQALLNWGSGEYHSKRSDDDLDLPVATLVNHETRAASEALAGVIRQAGAGLILGKKTAGQAMVARDFPLKNGERLR